MPVPDEYPFLPFVKKSHNPHLLLSNTGHFSHVSLPAQHLRSLRLPPALLPCWGRASHPALALQLVLLLIKRVSGEGSTRRKSKGNARARCACVCAWDSSAVHRKLIPARVSSVWSHQPSKSNFSSPQLPSRVVEEKKVQDNVEKEQRSQKE